MTLPQGPAAASAGRYQEEVAQVQGWGDAAGLFWENTTHPTEHLQNWFWLGWR